MARVLPKDWDPSGYKWMWLFALFDLPVVLRDDRREYAKFRKYLLSEGFYMLQFSVYARHCGSQEFADAAIARVRGRVPPHGQVRLLTITDKQFGKQVVLFGSEVEEVEDPPPQLMLF